MTILTTSEVKGAEYPFRMLSDPPGQAHAYQTGEAVRLQPGDAYAQYDGDGTVSVWMHAEDPADVELVALARPGRAGA